MISDPDATTEKLFRSFVQFAKVGWNHQSIEGCKPSEIRVLFCIRQGIKSGAPEINVSEISKLLNVTSPTVTQILKGLEANGHIERHIAPHDRRAIGVTLTPKGLMVTQKAHDAFFSIFHGLTEYLGEEQSDQLADLLSKVFHYFHAQEIHRHNVTCGEGEII